MDVWKKELAACKGFTKAEKDEYLILNTVDYVRSLKHSELVEQLNNRNNYQSDFEGKETYLGDIFASGQNVCRHNSFMVKLLLEDSNIPVGIQSGYIISPFGSGHHCWNTYKNSDNTYTPYDVTFDQNQCWYFSYAGDPFYINNLPKERQALFDVLSMQVGDQLLLGFDEDNSVVTNKMNDSANFFAKLYLSEPDQMNISSLSKDEDGLYDYTLDDKNNVIFYNTQNAESVFEFPFSNLVFFLKVRASSDCIKLSKLLNHSLESGKLNYKELMANKELLSEVDPSISKQMIEAFPDILGLN